MAAGAELGRAVVTPDFRCCGVVSLQMCEAGTFECFTLDTAATPLAANFAGRTPWRSWSC